MLSEKILWIVPVLSFVGSARYIYDVARGKAKPNRITWLLWALAPLIAFAAEIKQGVGLQSIVTFTSGFSPLIILVVSFLHKKSVWQITRFDIVCGVLSLLGLVMWLLTRHGNIAIIFSIFADCLAGVPTLIKSYKDPSSESPLVFAFGGISALLTLFTIDHWTFAAYGFPAYLLLMCASLVFFIVTKVGEQRGIKKSDLPFHEAEL